MRRSSASNMLYGDDLAWLHARHYSDFVNQAAPEVIRMLRAEGINHGLVCDVGCGAGQLSAALLQAGYDVASVDISASMISLARKQAPAAKLIHGSILDVTLPPCNAAVAVGEVFNYLGSRGRINRAFGNLFRALRPGGALIFDIKEPPLRKRTRMSCRCGPDWAVIARIGEDPQKGKLIRTITSFRTVGRHYRRQFEVHQLGIYPAEEVRRMLHSLGFRARIRAGYGTYRLDGERKVLVARKPETFKDKKLLRPRKIYRDAFTNYQLLIY